MCTLSSKFYFVGLFFLLRYKNQNVAIKIIQRGETAEEIAKKEGRFAREVAMLSRVQHKNLVKVVYSLQTNMSDLLLL